MNEEIGIIIVEDSVSYAECLTSMITMSNGMNFLGCYHSAEAFQHERDTTVVADVILLDLHLPGRDGFTLIPLIQEQSPESKVIVITQEDSYIKTLEAIRLGAAGYLLKNSSLSIIKQAIEDVHTGGCIIDPRLCGYVLKALEGSQKVEILITSREKQVLKLLAMGYTKKEVAAQLELSYSRIAKVVERIYEKLRVTNIAAAVATAIRCGLI